MVIPVTGTIPDSTLSPFQVRQKFSSQSMAGLGDTCMEYDFDTGDCVSWDTSGSFGFPAPSPITLGTGPMPLQPNGDPWPFDTSISTTKPSLISTYTDSGGDLVGVLSDGSTYTIHASSGQVTKGGGGTPVQGTITSAQASVWPSFINALAKAGVQIGTVAMLQPGQSLLPNGTIVGTGQSLIGAGGAGINVPSLTSLFSNPMLLIGGFSVLALLVLAGGRR